MWLVLQIMRFVLIVTNLSAIITIITMIIIIIIIVIIIIIIIRTRAAPEVPGPAGRGWVPSRASAPPLDR